MEENQKNIPKGWELDNLGKVVSFSTGKKDVNQGNPEGEYPFFTCSKTFTFSDEYSFDEEALMIAGNGDVGTVHYYKGKFEAYQRTYVLRDFKLDVQYLFQLLKSELIPHLLSGQSGTTIQFIKIGQLSNFQFLKPKSKKEQTQIATILSKVDEAITQTEQLIAKYTRIKTGLMQDLLTKGIDENGNIRSEETHEFKDSPLGRIPKEWECELIEDLADLKSGGTPSRQNITFWGGSIPWVKTGEVDYNIIYSTEEAITEKGLKFSSATLFPKNTILMALYGQGKTRGRVAILGAPSATNQACLGFLNLRRVTTNFLFITLCFEYEKLRELSNDGAQKNLSGNLLKKYLLKIPSDLKEQKKIDEVFKKIDLSIYKQKSQLSILQSLKTGLMQDLLSGKVRVNHLIKETVGI